MRHRLRSGTKYEHCSIRIAKLWLTRDFFKPWSPEPVKLAWRSLCVDNGILKSKFYYGNSKQCSGTKITVNSLFVTLLMWVSSFYFMLFVMIPLPQYAHIIRSSRKKARVSRWTVCEPLPMLRYLLNPEVSSRKYRGIWNSLFYIRLFLKHRC